MASEFFKKTAPPEKRVPVRYCPHCGRKPEQPPITEGSAHIWTVYCEKCDWRFVIHVIR
jgi:ribosomal protein L37AE/L43A